LGMRGNLVAIGIKMACVLAAAFMSVSVGAIEISPTSAYCMADFVFLGEVTNVELQRGAAEECAFAKLPASMRDYEEREEKDCGRLVYTAKVLKVLRTDGGHHNKFLANVYAVYFQFTDQPSNKISITQHIAKVRGARYIFPVAYIGGLFRHNAGYEWGLGYLRQESEEPEVLAATEEVCRHHFESGK
jgi:hypothetical protein